MAAAALHALGRAGEIAGRFPQRPAARRIGALLERTNLCPPTSSMGRVFDAAAALLGVAEVSRYEAEAAMRLEALARQAAGTIAAQAWRVGADGVLDLLPLLAILADWRGEPAAAAALFHATLAAAVGEWITRAAARTGLGTVALSGGSFLNRLREAKTPAERAKEFTKISGSLDWGKTLATIGMVAGRENLLINELWLRGERGFDLTVAKAL
jgi:hydrogenase maturation protein HypF